MAPHWPKIAMMLLPPATFVSIVAMLCAPPSAENKWMPLRTVMTRVAGMISRRLPYGTAEAGCAVRQN